MKTSRLICFFSLLIINFLCLMYLFNIGVANVKHDALGQLAWGVNIISFMTSHFIWEYFCNDVFSFIEKIKSFYIHHK